MVKRAVQKANIWMLIAIILEVLYQPLALLLGKPLFNGLIDTFIKSANKSQLVLIAVGTIVAAWLILFVAF